jgi:putative transcriptional regulator
MIQKKHLCLCKNKMNNLKNKLLVAMPNMADPYFAESVVLLCEDNDDGVLGLIINKPISQMKVVGAGLKNKFFKDLISESEKIYFGGPVMLHEACVLSEKDNSNVLFDISEKIKLSNDLDLIQKILFDDKNPKNTKLIFGHAAWDTNQLQNEIQRGDWLVYNNTEQIFNTSPKLIWGSLIKGFGLDQLNITGVGGVS